MQFVGKANDKYTGTSKRTISRHYKGKCEGQSETDTKGQEERR